ncbi:MAG: hypothetical protein Q7W02_06385 [Candidatus Rokubacteria bacterium]|nr:hypothetical protein [Candidatus Rokubacteria bacterium]
MDEADYNKARDDLNANFAEWRRLGLQAVESATVAMVDFEALAAYCVDPAHVLMTQGGAEAMATWAEAATKMVEGIRQLLLKYGFARRTGTVGTGMTIEGFPFRE